MRSRFNRSKKMTLREQAAAIFSVAKLSFSIAPGAVLFKLAGALVSSLVPFATAYFAALTTTALVAAYGGSEQAKQQVLVYIIITSVLGLFSLVWSSIDQYVQAKMRFIVESKVSDRMYEQFLRLEFWRYDDKETADLYDKAQKFSQFFAWIFDRLASIISQLITMIAGVVALVTVNVWMALFVLIAIIPGTYLQFRLTRQQVEHWNKNVETRRAKSLIEWNLLQPGIIVELRLYGIVRYLLDLRSTLRDKDEKARIEFERKYVSKRLLADALQAIAELGSLIWVTLQVISRTQPIGQFVYVQQIVQRALSGSNGFISELSSIDEDVANLFEYQKFMELAQGKVGTIALKDMPEKIEFKDVWFRYHGQDSDVLKGISFSIIRGQHIAIVGENGAGKTTLIKLLSGVYNPTKGEVLVDGMLLFDVKTDQWHKQLAVLGQDFAKYWFATAKDNVLFGDVDKNSRELLDRALRDAEAEEFVKKLPKGEDTHVDNWMQDDEGTKGVELSGGQWQRLALARNFYRDAPIIILDEPTSAIDALAESRIFKKLLGRKDKTIITISHRLTTVEKADVIYMLEEGELTEQGTHKELIAKKGRYYRMFESQLHESELSE